MEATQVTQAEATIAAICERTATAVADEFFRELTRCLGEWLGVPYALAGELVGDNQFRSLAFWANGKFVEASEYSLVGGPGEHVVRQGAYAYPRDVRTQFPTDPLLIDMEAEGYVGVRLQGLDGSVTGLLVVVDDRPMADPAMLRRVLEVFAARAGAELARCRQEQKLRSHAERLDLALAATNDGIYDWDIPSGKVYFDPRYYTMAGYTPDEFPGTFEQWRERVHPDDWTEAKRGVEAYVAGETQRYDQEFRFRRKDGQWMWIRARVRIVERDADGKPVRMVGTHTDITEHKRINDVLRESEQRSSDIFNTTSEAIFIHEAETGRVLNVNGRMLEMYRCTREQITGSGVGDFSSGIEPYTQAKALEMIVRADREGPQEFEWHARRLDGDLFWAEVSLRSTVIAGEHRVLATVHDITQRKQAEAEREQLEAQLRQAQKMEAVGQLAGGVAHDFNNLLQAILGYGEMARDEAAPDSEIRGFLNEIMAAGQRAKLLVSQLLAFSRRQVLRMEDLDLNEVIADLAKMIRRIIGEHITLKVLAADDIETVHADRGQITQILTNLCVNSRDAMPEGGTITVETANVQIDAAYCKTRTWASPGSYATLSVTDLGCGMDQETLEKAFEPFFTTKVLGKGTGLGLSTVYGLIKQHNGLIEAQSEVGKGTTFRIYLPVVDRPAAATAEATRDDAPGGAGTILLAEDDEMVRSVCKRMLEHGGYKVLTAVDGEDALRVFEQRADEIDLAVLDVVMPKLSGWIVCKRIRDRCPDMSVLFSSGYSTEVLHTEFDLGEGMALVQKPYQRTDLLCKVREMLDRT